MVEQCDLTFIHDARLPKSFNSARWKKCYNPDLIFASASIANMDSIPYTHRPITYCVEFRMQGFLDFDESFDSCIPATLSLFLSNSTPSSVSLLPIPLALNCRTLNVLSSLICSADGTRVGDGEGGGGVDCLVFKAEQGSQVQFLFLRFCAAFKSPEHFACTHPEHLVHR